MSGLSLNSAVQLLKSLLEFVKSQRSEFEFYEEKGKLKSLITQYKESSKQTHKRKRQFDEGSSAEILFTASEKFKVEIFLINIIIDKLSSVLQHRLEAYKNIHDKFGFLSNLTELSKDGILSAANKLMDEYSSDFEDCFPSELVQFSELFQTGSTSRHEQKEGRCAVQNTTSTEMRMLLLLNEFQCTQSFLNVHIALRIYLCMTTSNCSGERSFSKLKRIKKMKLEVVWDNRDSACFHL